MSEQWEYQVRIDLGDELAEMARGDPDNAAIKSPVDILTRMAIDHLKHDPTKVIGLGTQLSPASLVNGIGLGTSPYGPGHARRENGQSPP
jgi:malate/lactate dehydrogenase